jgi:hypothetical protein
MLSLSLDFTFLISVHYLSGLQYDIKMQKFLYGLFSFKVLWI